MNEYRIRSTGVVINDREFRTVKYPELMLPEVLTKEMLADLDADPVLASPAPDGSANQVAQRNGVVLDGLGNWVYAWTLASAPEPVIVVPQRVTRRQGLQQLYLEGITLVMIHQVIDQIVDETQRALARIEVDESLEFERDRPIIMMMWTAFGRDPNDLDRVFIEAAKL